MTVIRWNAFREFDDLLARAPQRPQAVRSAAAGNQRFTPLADISETEAGYSIELELPGLAAEDVEVSVHDGVLAVAGERVPEHVRRAAAQISATNSATDEAEEPSASTEDTGETPQLHRVERHYGSFERRFKLPKDADAGSVKARAKNGVLTLSIGRRAETARRAIEVQVA